MNRFVALFLTCCFLFGCDRRQSNATREPDIHSGDVRSSKAIDAKPSRLNEPKEIVATPLRAIADINGPLFTELTSEETGVEFVNYLKPENNVPYIYMGAGIACGDFDDDGLVDVYTLSVDGPNKLYRQTGDLHFEDVTKSAGNVDGGAAWSRGAAFLDIENDGDLDLYVCNTEAANLLYLNNGDGTFHECAAERGLDFVGASVMVGIADYDNDGDVDVYLVTHRALHNSVNSRQLQDLQIPADTKRTRDELEFRADFRTINGLQVPVQPDRWYQSLGHWEIAGGSDALFRNDGTGNFEDATRQSGIGNDPGLGLSCTWQDFDDDGLLDLHVANDLQSPDRLYVNQGDGKFIEQLSEILPNTSWYSMGSDFGDINNDGRLDFLVVDMASTTHYRAKVQMGDMSRFRYFMEQENPPQLMRNCLFLNSGTQYYMEMARLAGLDATDWTWSVRLNDLDNDGWVDAYFTNGIARADEMSPDLRAERERILRTDGPDALIEYVRKQPKDDTRNLAFRNTGNLHFENVSRDWSLDYDGISYAAAQVDLDGDGDLDQIVSNHNSLVSIYRNNSSPSHHRAIIRLHGRHSNRFGIGAKVTLTTKSGVQVRRLFTTRGYMTCDEPTIHFGLGSDSHIDELKVEWPSGHVQQFAGLSADHSFTISEPVSSPPPIERRIKRPPMFADATKESGLLFTHAEYNYDDYALQPLLPGKLSQLGPGVSWGDANGDGHDDVFIGGAAGQPGALFVNDSPGKFRTVDGPWQDDADSEDMGALWLDFDSDGDLDLLVGSGSSEFDPGDERLADRLYVNAGDATFHQAADDALGHPPGSTGAIAAVDFDQDGDLDLFVGGRSIPGDYPATPESYLLRNENGQFVDVTSELAQPLQQVGLVTSAVWSDFDSDGDSDLIVASEWGPIRIFANDRGNLTEVTDALGFGKLRGWWNSIVAGDIDNDGDMDLLTLNAGWNTKYGRPSGEKPTLLYYGDMDSSGTKQLIEVKSSDSGLLPVRGLSCSSHAMPTLREKFSTFHDFAVSGLTDIYEPKCLDKATKFEANELASGIWINDSGRFEFRRLADLAQISPGYGAALIDLDSDGWLDIYFAQNLYSREPETGAWCGGLSQMLRGDGTGNFTIVGPDISGLVVRGDAKGVGIADANTDGRPDILVSRNNGKAQFYLNQSASSNVNSNRRSISVRLSGPKGNPAAVGAKIRLIENGDVRQTIEIAAGSGYLSQSAPVAFFAVDDAAKCSIEIAWPDGHSATEVVTVGKSTWNIVR